jgi:hypothetical protein
LNFSSNAGIKSDGNFNIDLLNSFHTMSFNATKTFQNIEFALSSGTGGFVIKGGTGNYVLTINGNSQESVFYGNIHPAFSGTQDLGEVSGPFRTLYSNNVIQPTKTITGLTYTATTSDHNILIDSTGTALVSLGAFEDGFNVIFKDKSGLADNGSRMISISGVGCTIDGAPVYVINSNYGRLNLVSDGSNWFRTN